MGHRVAEVHEGCGVAQHSHVAGVRRLLLRATPGDDPVGDAGALPPPGRAPVQSIEMNPPGMTVLEDGDAAVVIDERSWPLVTNTWFGASTEPLVEQFFRHTDGQLDRAKARREKIVMIADTYAASPPSARVRRRITELTSAQGPRSIPLVLVSLTVIENVLIRGAVTALSWIDPSLARGKTVASFDDAVAGALAAMQAAGVRVPAVLPVRQADPRRASRVG